MWVSGWNLGWKRREDLKEQGEGREIEEDVLNRWVESSRPTAGKEGMEKAILRSMGLGGVV